MRFGCKAFNLAVALSITASGVMPWTRNTYWVPGAPRVGKIMQSWAVLSSQIEGRTSVSTTPMTRSGSLPPM